MRVLLAMLAVAILLQRPALADDGVVGFVVVAVPDDAGPPLEVGLWYPAAGAPARSFRIGSFTQDVAPAAQLRGRMLPLVVISHGSGGSFTSHADTALAFAQAGFVVAAPTHSGDNYRDGSAATDVAARTRHFAAVVSFVVDHWQHLGDPAPVDRRRIGAFGHSSGGFTILAAAGGIPDLTRITAHCAAHPDFFDCRLIALAIPSSETPRFMRSPYPLRVLAVAAPALGFTFAAGSLDGVAMPVQLWQASRDTVLPAPFYVEAVRAVLPRAPEFHHVEGAGHFDFLAPCTEGLARAVPTICTTTDGFDRDAFHARFNAEMIRFMTAAMSQ